MDGEEGKSGTEVEAAGDSSSEKDTSHVTDDGHESEGVPAQAGGASDHEEENSESVKAAEEPPVEADTCEPAEHRGDDLTEGKDLDVNFDGDSERPLSPGESVAFENDSNGGDGPPRRLRPETPGSEGTPSPAQEVAGEEEEEEGEGEEESTAAANPDPARGQDTAIRELCEERDRAGQRCSELQAKLAEYLRRKARDDTRLEREMPASEQLQEYNKHMDVLADLKRRLAADSEEARQKTEALGSKAQESLDKVETEWRAFVALKQRVAVAALSRCLGRQAAQAKVESTLAADRLRHEALIQLRLKHIRLTMRIHKLEAELRDGEERDRDPLQLQFEQLQAARLEQKNLSEKQREESAKLQSKISRGLELLSNVKEKLSWSQAEIRAKQEQLAEVEATVARKRGLLTGTKQACNRLQRDNLRLKECRGLLGNRVLLRDFEDTVDVSDHLQEELEDLKCRQAEIVVCWGRWKEKLGTAKSN